jgi:kynurenine formamidase
MSITRRELEEIGVRVRNWGRWGADDQRGTLNHIDPAVLVRAAGDVLQGKLFHLSLNLDSRGPQPANGRRANPAHFVTEVATPLSRHFPDIVYSDDVIHMPLQAATQWDALSHAHYAGELYNGCKACDTLSDKGAARLGIETLASPGIMSRGVLLDIARLKGMDRLPAGYAITPDDLNAASARQSVTVEAGDILLIRTGHIRTFLIDRDRQRFNGTQPGLSAHCAEWLHDRSVAAVAADNLAVEVMPEDRGQSETVLPLHLLCLRDMGCPLGEMFNLEDLAEDCARDGRYRCLLSAPPLAVTHAFGSPVNPLALK